jgi:hypothetical protein
MAPAPREAALWRESARYSGSEERGEPGKGLRCRGGGGGGVTAGGGGRQQAAALCCCEQEPGPPQPCPHLYSSTRLTAIVASPVASVSHRLAA